VADTRFRLGGLVEAGSVERGQGSDVRFVVTDTENTLPVVFAGILPNLFREGQGVVAEGRLNGAGIFEADTVLAKHDETYMPKEVADALKARGVWHEEGVGKQ
jgi:cytochrome c-type biogenesis protein CcmE